MRRLHLRARFRRWCHLLASLARCLWTRGRVDPCRAVTIWTRAGETVIACECTMSWEPEPRWLRRLLKDAMRAVDAAERGR